MRRLVGAEEGGERGSVCVPRPALKVFFSALLTIRCERVHHPNPTVSRAAEFGDSFTAAWKIYS